MSATASPRARPAGGARAGPGRGSPWLVAALLGLLVAPLGVGLAAARQPAWVPVLDLAQTEMRVRDVGSANTPLIGLPGRIGSEGERGSHPGPLSFYALAPIYRLLGASSWALQVATVALHAAALALALALARRLGGVLALAGLALALGVLMTGYGFTALAEPWNPYMPMLWWVVALLGAWAVLCGDLRALPVVAVAGSLCAQTHIPYLSLALGTGALAVAGAIVHLRRLEPAQRRAGLRWGVAALAVGVAAWAPPTLEQAVREPGNYGLLIEHFLSPAQDTIGGREALELVRERSDLVHLVAHGLADPGVLVDPDPVGKPSSARGTFVLLAWLACVAGALWLRHRALLGLHAVVGTALALGVLTLSRIFGMVWYYLMLWLWGVAALMALAMAWTAVALGARLLAARGGAPRPNGARGARGARLGAAALVLLCAMVAGRFALAAPEARPSDAHVSAVLAELVDEVAAALQDGVGEATGRGGTYLVTWTDSTHIGSQGFGLLNELERRGFRVGADYGLRATVTLHRVVHPAQATARVNLATGIWVERWRALPGVVELASIDPRGPAERAEFERLRAEVIAELERLGLRDVVPRVDDNLFGAAIDTRVPERYRRLMGEMLELGVPTAVFLGPPEVQP